MQKIEQVVKIEKAKNRGIFVTDLVKKIKPFKNQQKTNVTKKENCLFFGYIFVRIYTKGKWVC